MSCRWPNAISCSDVTVKSAARGSRIAAAFTGDASATRLERLGEGGHLRLRPLHGTLCEALVVNTAGGIVGGDRLAISVTVQGRGAAVTIGTAAAEKCYRTAAAEASVNTALVVGEGARLHWLPQETILFDGACLRRSLTIDLTATSNFLGVETVTFGRLAHGEVISAGSLHDSWRLRRAGRLIFAEETAIVAPIDETLFRKAIGNGARAMALLLAVGTGTEDLLDPLRLALTPFADEERAVESGISMRSGVLVARLLSRFPERLRAGIVAALGVVRASPLPRGWT